MTAFKGLRTTLSVMAWALLAVVVTLVYERLTSADRDLQQCADRWPAGTKVLNIGWYKADTAPGFVEGIHSFDADGCRVSVRWHLPSGMEVRSDTLERDLAILESP